MSVLVHGGQDRAHEFLIHERQGADHFLVEFAFGEEDAGDAETGGAVADRDAFFEGG